MWTHLPLIFSRSLAYLSLILFLYLFVLPLCAAIVLTDCQLNSEFHLEALGLKLGFFFKKSKVYLSTRKITDIFSDFGHMWSSRAGWFQH